MVSALRAAASFFAPDAMKCYAHCEKRDYQDLIVTKCSHIFCKACLAQSLATKKECPIDRQALPSIDSNEHTSFQLYLQRFTYYIIHDPATLKQKLIAAKALRETSCEKLKEKAQEKSPAKEEIQSDHCSICFEIPFQMYFIMEDEYPDKVGRHMHEGCWQAVVDNKSVILDISVQDLVKVAEQLPPPRALPPEPSKPPSPIKVFFLAIILPMSIWALATNSRVYHNKNFALYVLSIPALLIFKISSLLWSGLKAVFTAKHAK